MYSDRQLKQLLVILIIVMLLGIIGLDTYLTSKIDTVDQKLTRLEKQFDDFKESEIIIKGGEQDGQKD